MLYEQKNALKNAKTEIEAFFNPQYSQGFNSCSGFKNPSSKTQNAEFWIGDFVGSVNKDFIQGEIIGLYKKTLNDFYSYVVQHNTTIFNSSMGVYSATELYKLKAAAQNSAVCK